MIMDEDSAKRFCAERCSPESMIRLETFVAALREENASQNLVAASSLDQVWKRHLADSLQLMDHAEPGAASWLDLGSGAGLPGLPLAIAMPDRSIVLVESRKRRIDWLNEMVTRLGLGNCRVEGSRLENVAFFEAAVITARAFAPLDRLLTLSSRFSTSATQWILPKGQSGAQELAQQPRAIRAMFHVEQSKTSPEAGILIGRGRPSP